MTTSPFDYIKTINKSKKDIMVDDVEEKDYKAFIVNKGLSWFNDTVHYANEMNKNHHLPNRLQYDFLLNTIRKGDRFEKWSKPISLESLEVIQQYYGYSAEKAKNVLQLLNDNELNELKERMYKGGKRKR